MKNELLISYLQLFVIYVFAKIGNFNGGLKSLATTLKIQNILHIDDFF